MRRPFPEIPPLREGFSECLHPWKWVFQRTVSRPASTNEDGFPRKQLPKNSVARKANISRKPFPDNSASWDDNFPGRSLFKKPPFQKKYHFLINQHFETATCQVDRFLKTSFYRCQYLENWFPRNQFCEIPTSQANTFASMQFSKKIPIGKLSKISFYMERPSRKIAS